MRIAHRLALVTGGATLLLIVLGGLVTNTGSALAVPDWPTTFGHNLFLYPWSEMVGGVLWEHSHRLLGALVGLLTVALGAALWSAGGIRRALGLIAVGAVILQGVLGGLRVVLLQDTLAIVHGCLAQVFLALLAVITLLTSRRTDLPTPSLEPSTRALTVATAAVVLVQIVLGALLTHAGRVELHLTGALAVFVMAPLASARLRRSRDPIAAPAARALGILVVVQLILGSGTLLARYLPEALPHAVLPVALPVAHRLAGGVMLAVAVVLAVRVWAARTPAPALAETIESPA